jgi:hypothetical protein
MALNPPSSVIVRNALYVQQTGLTETQVIVSWTPINGVSGYNIYRNLTPYGDFTQLNLAGLIGATSFLDTDVPFIIDTDPYYAITSVNVFGESLPSQPLTYENPKAWSGSPFGDINLPNTVAGGTIPGSLTIGASKLLPICTTATTPYFFKEVRRRGLWLLEQDGADVWLFKRKMKEINQDTSEDYARNATVLFYPAIKIKVRIVDTKALKELANYGFRRQNIPRSYTVWTPRLVDHDIVLDSEGRLYEITNVTGYYWRQQITHQDFEMRMMERTDDAYTNPTLVAPSPLAPYAP